MRILLFFLFFSSHIIGISQINSGQKFILNGRIINRDTGFITLKYTNSSGLWIKDTAILKDGVFRFEGEISEPEFAILSGKRKIIDFEEANYTNIFIEPVTQSIELYENDYVHGKMEGSRTQKEFDTLNMHLNSIKTKYKTIYQELIIAKKEFLKASTEAEKDISIQKQNELIGLLQPEIKEDFYEYISFIREHPDSYVSAYFLVSPARDLPIDSTKSMFLALTPRVQQSKFGRQMIEFINRKEINAIGDIPFIFTAKDINDKNISLADFKGKFVYIDFWASWCVPCRKEIPHIKSIADQYSNAGLEIITISIDKEVSAWKKAVETEKIFSWHNILVTKEIEKNYENVNNPIPSGILISKEGIIVWKSGKEESLEEALKRLVK